MAVGLVAAFMTLLDVSIVNVAVPSIQRALDAGPNALQWVLSGYALTFGLVLVPAGRYGDARGRRNIFVFGLALFTVASAAAGMARSPEWLIAARLVQGAAAGVVNPQVAGLIQRLFAPAERGRPFGLLGATIGISTAIGPLLGGLLIQTGGTHEGWRWIFYVNIPIGIAAIAFALRLLPSRPHPGRQDLDPVGVALLGTGVLLILLPLVEIQQWSGWQKWLLVPAGLAVLAGFVGWERRYRGHRQPVFDLALFRLRSYTLGVLIALLYFAGFTAIFFVFTLYLQNGLHYSALIAGLSITPFALGAAVSSTLGGRIVNRYGRPLVACGLALVAAGLGAVVAVLHFVPGRGAPLAIAAPLAVAGLGSGLVITPNQTLTLAEVPVPQAGSAAGMLQTAQRVGAALGIAGVGSIFFSTLHRPGTGYASSFRQATLVTVGFVLVSLVIALADVRSHRTRS
ncbi:MFS transporter [Plantactinospora sp. KBS50]|uniref:MFS transporter n=1 Tax=Plantactinospora sp. KBS50 TaxID=2024580 RepID=UPI000BAAEDB1|nr:MFS transporter [Plantactinospora sp. KBS50]ASW57649.1 MFS transporter [Plantactinospora sp. KBS50]